MTNILYNCNSIVETQNALQKNKEHFSKVLKMLKTYLGISGEDLALETGLSPSTISRILNHTQNYKLDNAILIYNVLMTKCIEANLTLEINNLSEALAQFRQNVD